MMTAYSVLCQRIAAVACVALISLSAGAVQASARTFRLYVLGTAAVTPISTSTNTPGSPILIPPGLGQPSSIVATPNGRSGYVGIPPSVVLPISLRSGTVGAPIPVLFSGLIAIAPNGERVYAPWEQLAGSLPGLLSGISTRTNTVVFGAAAGAGAFTEAVTPNDRFAYVSLSDAFCSPCNEVSVVSLTGTEPLRFIRVGDFPGAIAMAPNGERAYVVVADDAVTPIDLRTNTALPRIAVGRPTRDIAIAPSGGLAYVTNGDSVTPIDLRTNTPLTPIALGRSAGTIAITPDGRYAYVANYRESSVTPIELSSNRVLAPIPVPGGAIAIAITVPPS